MSDSTIPPMKASANSTNTFLAAALVAVSLAAIVLGIQYFQAERIVNRMPIGLTLDRHAITPGYNLIAYNRTNQSLRVKFTIEAMGLERSRYAVIDGGRRSVIPGIASGDRVVIESPGYDDLAVNVQ
jgi:hypothetical protein